MTANPWHSADGVIHKSWPVISSNLFLLSFLFMEGEVPFFFTLEQEEFFTNARTHYHFPVLSVSLSSGCQSQATHFLLIMSFYGSFLPALYGEGYMQSSTLIALAVNYNIFLDILQHVSTDPFSVAHNTVAVVRMRSTKPRIKSMRNRIPEGIRSFSERKNWLQLAERFFQVFFCPL